MKSITLIIFLLCFSTLGFSQVEWALVSENEGWSDIEYVKLYNRSNEVQRLWAESAISAFKITEDAKILDFGSGDGKVSSILSFRVPKGTVLGIDVSKYMVDFAQKKYPIKNINFSRSDLEMVNGKFDIITSFSTMHLLPNPLSELKKINDLLTSDGKILLVYPSGDKDYLQAAKVTMDKFALKMPNSDVKNCTLRIRVPEEAKIILKESGFDITFFTEIKERVWFVDDEDFINWSKGTTSKNWNIPKNIDESFHRAFIEEYIKLDPASVVDGAFYPRINHIVIQAKKHSKSELQTHLHGYGLW